LATSRSVTSIAMAQTDHEARSILVIHQGAVGDFILALPALAALRKSCPRARFVLMGYPGILGLAKNRFYAEEITSIDQHGMASFFLGAGKLDEPLSEWFGTFDLIVAFGKRSAETLVRNIRRVATGRVLHIQSFSPERERIHQSDFLLRELRSYGVLSAGAKPVLCLTDKDRQWGEDYCRRIGLTPEETRGAVVIHPGSGSPRKVWPLDRFLSLIEKLEERRAARMLVVIGPAEGGEIEQAFEGKALGARRPAPVLLKDLSLLELASVIGRAGLFVGNDSGISHMASALGVATVAIFGPTDPVVWAPRGNSVIAVQSSADCCPCPRERLLQCSGLECLNGVAVQDVLEAIERVAPDVQSGLFATSPG
jgi:ADP-heptose:LPS heptosyltransferase